MRTIADFFSSFNRTHFFFSQYRSKIVVEPTISHTTMRFRRIRRPSGLGRQLKFRFSRPCSRADELAAVVGPPIPLLLNTSRLYIPVQTRPKILKYVANMPHRMARRPEFIGMEKFFGSWIHLLEKTREHTQFTRRIINRTTSAFHRDSNIFRFFLKRMRHKLRTFVKSRRCRCWTTPAVYSSFINSRFRYTMQIL